MAINPNIVFSGGGTGGPPLPGGIPAGNPGSGVDVMGRSGAPSYFSWLKSKQSPDNKTSFDSYWNLFGTSKKYGVPDNPVTGGTVAIPQSLAGPVTQPQAPASNNLSSLTALLNQINNQPATAAAPGFAPSGTSINLSGDTQSFQAPPGTVAYQPPSGNLYTPTLSNPVGPALNFGPYSGGDWFSGAMSGAASLNQPPGVFGITPQSNPFSPQNFLEGERNQFSLY